MSNAIAHFALIIGAMKCGTTSLFDYLAQHPQICPCKIKEPNFFADNDNWDKGFAWYQSLWDWNPDVHKIALEASTHYTKMPKFPNAAPRISQIEANFKFIYIMRNPLDRIESHYTHGKTVGWETTKISSAKRINSQLIEVSRYATQIKEYYQRFSTKDILLVKFEDLKKNPQNVVSSVINFLELDPEYQFTNLGVIANANKQRIEYPTWVMNLKNINNLIPVSFKEVGKQILGKKINKNINLTEKEKQDILLLLREDMWELQEKFQFDTSSWKLDI